MYVEAQENAQQRSMTCMCVASRLCVCVCGQMQVNVIAAPHPNPPNAKKGPNNKKQMCFLESKNMEIQKNALTL